MASDPEAVDLLDRALQNPAHVHVDVDNVNVRPTGNGRSAALRRLRKDSPELHQDVLAEVWLRTRENGLGITCTVVNTDETTHQLDVESLSMRGAQREITGHMLQTGHETIGRWSTEAEHDGQAVETTRTFRLKK